MLLIATLPAMAREFTTQELGFRNQIQSYIREEGYSPSIATDGTIEFKYQGRYFWVNVIEYKNGFYVDIHTGLTITEDQYASAIIAADEVARKYLFLQTHLNKDNTAVWIRMPGYFTNITTFKDVFISWTNTVYDARLEIYNSL